MTSKLTKEQALELHYKMWRDMQKELGDNASPSDRKDYKAKWCRRWCTESDFGYEEVYADCFLCEYTQGNCSICPIDWSAAKGIDNGDEEDYFCTDIYTKSGKNGYYYLFAPISIILEIPERKDTKNE